MVYLLGVWKKHVAMIWKVIGTPKAVVGKRTISKELVTIK